MASTTGTSAQPRRARQAASMPTVAPGADKKPVTRPGLPKKSDLDATFRAALTRAETETRLAAPADWIGQHQKTKAVRDAQTKPNARAHLYALWMVDKHATEIKNKTEIATAAQRSVVSRAVSLLASQPYNGTVPAIGAQVELADPDEPNKTVTGTVTDVIRHGREGLHGPLLEIQVGTETVCLNAGHVKVL